MRIVRVGMAAVFGTTLMTAFSYLISGFRGKRFKEPQLLNELIARADFIDFSPSKEHTIGWLLHYKVGLMFCIIYDLIWRKAGIQPNVKNSLVLGGISGIFGIMVWNIVFKLHPNPPEIKLKEFNTQLFIAHLIFGYYAMKGYVLLPREIGK